MQVALIGFVGFVACQDGGYDIGAPAPAAPQRAAVAYSGSTGQGARPYNFNNRNVNNIRGNNYFRPETRYQGIQNLRSENVNNGDGTYNYFYENDDGTSVSQQGYLKGPRTVDEESIQVQEGFYQYYSPEGQLLRVSILYHIL